MLFAWAATAPFASYSLCEDHRSLMFLRTMWSTIQNEIFLKSNAKSHTWWQFDRYTNIQLIDSVQCNALQIFALNIGQIVQMSLLQVQILASRWFPNAVALKNKCMVKMSVFCHFNRKVDGDGWYLWGPMRLSRRIGSGLTFWTWFPDFLRKHLSNICGWFWFLHINVDGRRRLLFVRIVLFMPKKRIFAPAACVCAEQKQNTYTFILKHKTVLNAFIFYRALSIKFQFALNSGLLFCFN